MDEKQFLEDLFWTSYRYCIGRHTYVTLMARDMAEYFYDKLSDERKNFVATDIRREIAMQLRMQPFNFDISWNYTKLSNKPMETFLEFVNRQDVSNSHWLDYIAHIDIYKAENKSGDNDDFDADIAYRTKPIISVYEYELLDLLPWMNLAALFDIKNHKWVVCDKEDGTEEIIECYESYINETEEVKCEGALRTLKTIPWRYKKVYRPVSKRLSETYIDSDFIKEIKGYDDK